MLVDCVTGCRVRLLVPRFAVFILVSVLPLFIVVKLLLLLLLLN